jgi:hypothetical protein
MLFADGFWEIKNLSDTVTIVGFLVTLFSIWFAWWLAARDLQKRIRDGQKHAVQRLTRILLQLDLTETGRCLREAREACRANRWERAIDRCEQAKHRIPTFLRLPGIGGLDRRKLIIATDKLRLLIRQLEDIQGKLRVNITPAKIKDLDDLITALATIEGKTRAAGLR